MSDGLTSDSFMSDELVSEALLARGVASDEFCETLSRIPTGLTVVTVTTADGSAHGTTVSAFSSLSLDPPLVLIALSRSSDLLRSLLDSARFGISLLGAQQEEVGYACARKGRDKLATVSWTEDDGLPRVDGSAAWLVCELREVLPGGDHLIVTGLVTRCEAGAADPLVYHRRRFHRIAG